MRPLPFTLRQLEVFASLCETGSFRRSAEKLGISQASVSNQTNALEEQLGQALFVRRRGRGPTLTAVGQSFLDDLQAFSDAGQTLAAYRRNRAQKKLDPVRLRVLIGQGTIDRFIRPKLDRFVAAHPSIELTFETRMRSDELTRDIAAGRYDFVLVHRLVSDTAEPGLSELAKLRGGIYGHRKFAEGRRLPLTPAEVESLPFIMPTTYPSEDEMTRFYRRNGIRPRTIVGRTQHYDVTMAMVGRGIGVSCFTDAILAPDLRDEVIMLHPLENWRLMWLRKDDPGDPRRDAVEAFLKSSVLGDANYRTISEPAAAA